MNFSYTNELNQNVAELTLHGPFGSIYVIETHKTDQPVPTYIWADVIKRAKNHAVKNNDFKIIFRPLEGQFRRDLDEQLLKMGFIKKHKRIEFKTLVTDLPNETGTPFKWKPVTETGEWNLENAAQILLLTAKGDPDFDPNENPLVALKGFLSESHLTHTLDTIQIGFIANKPAAFIMVQTENTSGWSRITFMGVAPEYRKHGLGKWVHRHGFSMMKQQNGSFYQGGTVASNEAMIRLFEQHGCKVYRRMQGWEFSSNT